MSSERPPQPTAEPLALPSSEGSERTAPLRRVAELEDTCRRLENLVVRAESKIASILEIANALRATRSEEELLDLIAKKIALLMDADRSTLFLKDDRTNELWTMFQEGRRSIEVRLGLGEGIAGWVGQTGQSINIKDAYKDDRFNPDIDHRTGYSTRSVLCQPMRNQERRIIGVIQVLNKRHGYFTVDDELLLSAIAAQAATVIENSTLYHSVLETNYELNEARERLEHKISEQNLLFEIQRRISQAFNLEEIVQTVAERVLSIVASEACVVTLHDEDSAYRTFLVRSPNGRGARAQPMEHTLTRDDDGPSAIVIAQGVPYLCNSKAQCLSDTVLTDSGLDVRSVVAVPMFFEEAAIGSIELVNRRGVGDEGRPAEFGDTDLKFLTLLAAQVGPAIATSLFRTRKEKADRMATVGQMVSGILHDLRTPFTIISGYVQLMARKSDEAQRQEYGERIKAQFDHLSQMQQEILAFARGESTILLTKVYLNRFMAEVEELLRHEFDGRGIELEMDVRYKRTSKFDQGKLKRVIFNLARNAIEAMPEGGRFVVSVSADEATDQLVFRFSDSGRGIPDDIRDRLFESFVTRGKQGGTGLGLAIVKKIVEEHRGQIDFESEIGKGTTFEVRLPLDA